MPFNKKDYMKKYFKNYYQNNKQKLIDYDRAKRDDKYICICRSNISRNKRSILNHLNTNKHKKFMNNFINQV